MSKFKSLKLAESYREHSIKAKAIVMGDDGRFWVVTLAEMQRLERLGYEVL